MVCFNQHLPNLPSEMYQTYWGPGSTASASLFYANIYTSDKPRYVQYEGVDRARGVSAPTAWKSKYQLT